MVPQRQFQYTAAFPAGARSRNSPKPLPAEGVAHIASAANEATPFSLDVEYRPRVPVDWSGTIGIVGAGAIVREAHLPAYRKYGMEVGGVYDRVTSRASEVAREFGVPRVFDRLDDLLSDPRITVVDIATPPEVRMPLVLEALAAGKHVLSQKPFATSIGNARTMIRADDESHLKLAVNQNAR